MLKKHHSNLLSLNYSLLQFRQCTTTITAQLLTMPASLETSKSTALFISINIIIKACICSFPDKNLTAAKQSSDDLKKKRTIRLKAWCFKQELFHTKTTSKATQESCKASPTQPKFGLNIWLNTVVPLILIWFSGIKTHLISLTDPISGPSYTALQTEREGKKEKARKRGRVLSHLSMALSPSVFA